MFRTMMALGLLAMAMPAMAGKSPKVESAKAEMKADKASHKEMSKAASTWLKGREKGKDKLLDKGDERLTPAINSELQRLWDLGLPKEDSMDALPRPTRVVKGEKMFLEDIAATEPVYAKQWEEHLAKLEALEDQKLLTNLRDQLQELRGLTKSAKGKDEMSRKEELVKAVDKRVAGRYERAQKAYEKVK